MKPVFMIGTQRSGSNLLRLMLNQLKEIASPHPPHILERMYPLIDTYGDLSIDSRFESLVDDVCRLVELNPVEWSDVKLDRKAISEQSKSRTLMGVYESVYDLYAMSQGAKTWCCKSMANIKYASEIENHFVDPKYIYLYRDGRDVALSFQKAVVGEKHIYNIAKEWEETQTLALEIKSRVDADSFYGVQYEELIQHPEETAKSLCAFLGIDYVPEMLDFHKTNEARNAAKSSQLWGNVTSPIIQNNSKKYIHEMPEDEIMIFESVAGHILDQLGYERDYVKQGEEKQFSQAEINEFNQINRRKKLENLLNLDKADKERRELQSQLLLEIKSRSAA